LDYSGVIFLPLDEPARSNSGSPTPQTIADPFHAKGHIVWMIEAYLHKIRS